MQSITSEGDMMKYWTGLATIAMACTPLLAEPPASAPDRPDALVPGPLEPLNHFVGDWTIEATWAFGATLSARNQYRVGIGGSVLEARTIVSDNGGEPYERYHSFFMYDAVEKQHFSLGFDANGSFTRMEHTLDVVDGKPYMEFESTGADGVQLRQTFEVVDQNATAWKVWTIDPQGNETQIMDGTWKRDVEAGQEVGAKEQSSPDPWASAGAAPQNGPHAVAADIFESGGRNLRSFVKHTEIEASASDLFAAWSNGDSWKHAFGPDRTEMKANIDLAIGGRYEWLFDGWTGSNGCQVLSYIPDRMISFSWNAPPEQPESRLKRTWVVVELEPLASERTRVTLTHLGFGDGPLWDETTAYFDRAWGQALETFARGLAGA